MVCEANLSVFKFNRFSLGWDLAWPSFVIRVNFDSGCSIVVIGDILLSTVRHNNDTVLIRKRRRTVTVSRKSIALDQTALCNADLDGDGLTELPIVLCFQSSLQYMIRNESKLFMLCLS